MINFIKERLLDKRTIAFIILSFFLFITIFICFKTNFYYEVINYIKTYLIYYINKYVGGVAANLVLDNYLYFYVENDVMNIMSSLFIYGRTFQDILFKAYMVLFPLFIYYLIDRNLFNEIHEGFIRAKVSRIGLKKYQRNLLFSNAAYGALLAVIPKTLYFIVLSIFFPIGVSSTHILSNSSFIERAYLYTGTSLNPWIIMLLDFSCALLYGAIIGLIVTIVIPFVKKRAFGYLTFIFVLAGLSILSVVSLSSTGSYILGEPIFAYLSIFQYIELLGPYKVLPVFKSIIEIGSIFIFISFLSPFILKKKWKEYV